MYISKLIEQLNKLYAMHGDLNVLAEKPRNRGGEVTTIIALDEHGFETHDPSISTEILIK